MTDTTTIIDEIRAALEKATPGEWGAEIDLAYGEKPRLETNDKLIAEIGNAEEPRIAQDEWDSNARYIVAVQPDRIRALLDHIDALSEELTGTQTANQCYTEDFAAMRSRAEAAEARVRELEGENAALKAERDRTEAERGEWLPIDLADRTITDVEDFSEVGITLRMSDRYWVRDEDGRVYEAAWSEDNNGRDFWWDFESESPVDPVEFMPHPLDPRFASALSTGQEG
jgi:hypothetical protein